MMIESIIYAVFIRTNFFEIGTNGTRYRIVVTAFIGILLTWIIYLKDMIGITIVKKFIQRRSQHKDSMIGIEK